MQQLLLKEWKFGNWMELKVPLGKGIASIEEAAGEDANTIDGQRSNL